MIERQKCVLGVCLMCSLIVCGCVCRWGRCVYSSQSVWLFSIQMNPQLIFRNSGEKCFRWSYSTYYCVHTQYSFCTGFPEPVNISALLFLSVSVEKSSRSIYLFFFLLLPSPSLSCICLLPSTVMKTLGMSH